jgi:hypothetical protein
MNKFRTLFACVAILFAANSVAQTLTADDIDIDPGKTAQLDIKLDAEKVAVNAQFNLLLPSNITINQKLNDDEELVWDIKKSTSATILYSGAQVVINEIEGGYSFLIYKVAEDQFSSNKGTLLSVKLKAADTETGVFDGKLSGIKIGDKDGPIGTFADSEFKIGVGVSVGINDIYADGANGDVYNTAGQRVSRTTKGLYIQNGKKVVKK